MTKSTFTIVKVTHDRVFIEDQDVGMSVTNDADNVVPAVLKVFPGKRIIYKDTEGRWGELVHGKGQFVGFEPYNEELP